MEFYRRHELPETVRKYKKYTDQFQEWLIKTATARHVEVAEQVRALDNKAKGKTGYKIPVNLQEHLANSIARTAGELSDTSGLLYLGDAIRSRKEIAQYYKSINQMDEGHARFNLSLDNIMTTLKKLWPTSRKAEELDDEATSVATKFLFIHFSSEEDEEDDIEQDTDYLQSEQSGSFWGKSNGSDRPAPTTEEQSTNMAMTPLELQAQQDFLLLRFLYEFNRIRQVVRDVWLLYHGGLANVSTAALVTDLAQSYMLQSVTSLVEDLDIARGKLSDTICALHTKVNPQTKAGLDEAENQDTWEIILHDVFCMNSIKYIHNYFVSKGKVSTDSNQIAQSGCPIQAFLQFFTVIRLPNMKLPLWDRITQTMLRREVESMDWLPFGLQIILDIQAVVRDMNDTLLHDITEHSIDISTLMRMHIDYEDQVWTKGRKPDYSTTEFFKFSSMFLKPLDSMLAWLQKLLPGSGTTSNGTQMTTDTFVTQHPTLAGLAMWQHNRQYRSTTINTVQWSIMFLCHIYNAARQAGGLSIAWPDLEFIIQAHGHQRIFVGASPQHPTDFLDRYLLASGVSVEHMAADSRKTGKYPMASRDAKKKRSLKSSFPLEEKIRSYYGPGPDQNRWMKRHAIFHYLHEKKKDTANSSKSESDEAIKQVQDLQSIFSSVAAQLGLPESEPRCKKGTRVVRPDFSKIDETHFSLLQDMKTELQAEELHNNFDYLSFYRHAYEIVLKIRDEVLFNNDMALDRHTNMWKAPDPSNFALLRDLFSSLKTQAQKPKPKDTGTEVSTAVGPLDQLKHIAKIMESFIGKNGATEMGRANMRLNRDWDGLKAAYAAEAAARQEEEESGASNMTDGDEASDENDRVYTEEESPAIEHSTGLSSQEQRCDAMQEPVIEAPTSLGANHSQTTGDFDVATLGAEVKTFKGTTGDVSSFGSEEVSKPAFDKKSCHQAYVTDEAEEADETDEPFNSLPLQSQRQQLCL